MEVFPRLVQFFPPKVPRMSDINKLEQKRESSRTFLAYLLPIVFAALVAIVATFLLANSPAELTAKTLGFAAIVVAFLFACASLHLLQIRTTVGHDLPNGIADATVERGLAALDEAGELFAGSLRSADSFRLVANRVRELLPFRSIVLFLLDGTRTRLRVAECDGPETAEKKDKTIGFGEGLAGQCFSNRRIEINAPEAIKNAVSSVAIPLFHGTDVFGVLQLYFDADFDIEHIDEPLFEAIATRVAPLMSGSIAIERSQANALTDITTDLPNERAFYMILENQIAEAQRKRDERPLAVLAIDIKNFDDINQQFGHTAGDRTLNFVAQIVKDNLRQMDFLARSIGDEFIAILPTATLDITKEIMARIDTGFFGQRFQINDEASIEIELTIGWSVFGNDGETAAQLLSLAQLRKAQAKSPEPGRVLWFPMEQEMVN